MLKRLASLAAILAATVALTAPASAAAAPQPWWQIVTGSRPSNLWTPKNEVQELKTKKGGLLTVVFLEGSPVACLGAFCPFLGMANSEAPADLQAALEAPGAYGPGNVEVEEEPAESGRYLITSVGEDAGREVAGLSAQDPINHEASVKTIQAGGSGRLLVTLANLGDAPLNATEKALEITDKMPAGVEALNVEGRAGTLNESGPIDCEVKASDLVSCRFEGTLPSYQAIEIETSVSLKGEPPVAGAPGKVTVSGANAQSKSENQPLRVGAETPFGIEQFSSRAEEVGGAETIQAGAHPFQVTNTIQFNAGVATGGAGNGVRIRQPAQPRNLRFPLPAGLVGVVSGMPKCTLNQFFEKEDPNNGGGIIDHCSDATAVGVVALTFVEPVLSGYERRLVPVFNLAPGEGEPARFGFYANGAVPVIIDAAVDPADHYRLVASVSNTTQLAAVLSSTLSIWGTPGDPSHDSSRGWGCLDQTAASPCTRPGSLFEDAFLRAPASCTGPLDFEVEAEPWNAPLGSVISKASFEGAGLHGCNQVPFDPSISAASTSKLAANPSGLDFRLTMPNSNLSNPKGIAETQPKKVEVALPEGVTINPSAGEGLAVCSPAEYARETAESGPGEGCPEASKIGSVKISTPLLDEEASGALYQAAPYENPSNSLLGLYLVAKIPDRGVIVKEAGKVEPDPQTGQLVTTFDDLPQIPFSSFELNFREGGRAPLVTPPGCGSFQTVARFTPWSASDLNNPAPNEIVTRNASFTIERGVDGGACPSGGLPPFKPNLLAGTRNNAAGSFSPFDLRLTRTDGEQEFTHFSIKLPPGVVGKLAGIPFCPDAAIAAAKARTGPHGGAEELASPSCPAASEVGHTLVGSGVGSILTYVPGKVYLAGPYHGSPLSIAAITAAKVGPFDLGTVVVREALRINPETAEVFVDATGSDPIPHIIQGIPVHARDIRVYVSRPDFVLNPTSCERTSTASTVLGSGLDFSTEADDNPLTVTSPFQAADCASLGFKPRLSLKLNGKTRRGGNPALHAVLRPRPGDANPSRISVALPHSEFLDQGHIRTVCTRVQFNAGAGNGAECPRGAVYGHAKAWTPLFSEPLEGPIFLRSSEHPLPDLVLALHGLVDVDAVGRIDSVNGGIRNTFDFVPDAPISKVVVDLPGGKKSLLENSTNICLGSHQATVKMEGHNGRIHNLSAPLKASCGKAKKQARPRKG